MAVRAEIGEVRERASGPHKKVAEGKWVRWAEGSESAGPEKKPEEHASKRALGERARDLSHEAPEIEHHPVGSPEYAQQAWKDSPPKNFVPAAFHTEERGKRGGTEEMHWDAAKNDYTEARKKLHEDVISEAFRGKTPPPADEKIAVVMMGGTASGKSTMLRKSGIANENFVHVDADSIKEKLPEYKEAIGYKWRGAAAFAHEESSTIAKTAVSRAVGGGFNVVIDGTGANVEKFMRQVSYLKESGYHVHLMMPDQDKGQAVKDAEKRANHTGRYVPSHFIESAYEKIPGNFFKVAKIADSAELFDRRRDGKRVWSKDAAGVETAHDPDFLSKFPGYTGGSK